MTLFRTSGLATVIQSVILLITAVVFAIILYNIAVSIYGEQTRKWTDHIRCSENQSAYNMFQYS